MALRRSHALGIALSIGSGLAFAVQPVLGQLALDRGAAITSLLGWRYAVAAVVLVFIARRRLSSMPLWAAGSAFALGVALYAGDSALFYAALGRTSAPFATLLHYAYLVVVVGTAALLGREPLGARRVAALGAVIVGVALVGGGAGAPDALGIALALASALACAAYVLVSDRILVGVDPVAFATPLVAGAAAAFLVFGATTGRLTTLSGGVGVVAVLVGALLGTVFAMSAFLAGMRLLGPGTASLLATVEVPAGVALAALALGERLAPAQLAGAVLVLAAIVLLQVRVRLSRRRAQVHSLPVPAAAEPASAAAA
jgi:drug/metabolite transporter (DMT)-like permease